MIIVKLMGGLGNQMFQYATARRLSHQHNSPLRLDITVFDNMEARDTPRHFELEDYQIYGKVASQHELDMMLPQDFQAGMPYRLKRRLGLDNRLRPLGEGPKGLNGIVLRARDNTYLVGWWQNEGYFKDIRETLLREFTPKKVSSYNKSLLKQMGGEETISIHVRRGDYVSNKHASKEHGLVSMSYYETAIAFVRGIVEKPRFYVFSDDLEWCRKNLNLGKDAIFVDGNGVDRAYEDIHLMQHCQHNIVANSSFSWWGAWLNVNPNKIVIAPKQWFQNKQTDQETEIVPASWTRL
jgi:Glycosyl transferase family 11